MTEILMMTTVRLGGSDKSGRYPDDPECAAPYSTVPVLACRH
jgi:hypothetical protein